MQDQYLLKSTSKDLCYLGIGYINYIYDDRTWLSTGPRKRAKVFTKAEALALKPRTFKIVKK